MDDFFGEAVDFVGDVVAAEIAFVVQAFVFYCQHLNPWVTGWQNTLLLAIAGVVSMGAPFVAIVALAIAVLWAACEVSGASG